MKDGAQVRKRLERILERGAYDPRALRRALNGSAPSGAAALLFLDDHAPPKNVRARRMFRALLRLLPRYLPFWTEDFPKDRDPRLRRLYIDVCTKLFTEPLLEPVIVGQIVLQLNRDEIVTFISSVAEVHDPEALGEALGARYPDPFSIIAEALARSPGGKAKKARKYNTFPEVLRRSTEERPDRVECALLEQDEWASPERLGELGTDGDDEGGDVSAEEEE